jgi:hypothetical protein
MTRSLYGTRDCMARWMRIWHRFCKREGRILLTLDLDLSDIRAYLPEEFPGILVLRPDKTGILYSRLAVEYYRF